MRASDKPTHCECGEKLIDTITTCSGEGCDCKIVILVCHTCKRAWGFDWSIEEWVELQEVEDDSL